MASGRLGAEKPAATTYTTLYKPTDAIAHCSILFCNQNDASDTMRIAIVQSGSTDPTPASEEFIAFNADVKAAGDEAFGDHGMVGPIELNSVNNDQIVVYSTGGNISFVCVGKESV